MAQDFGGGGLQGLDLGFGGQFSGLGTDPGSFDPGFGGIDPGLMIPFSGSGIGDFGFSQSDLVQDMTTGQLLTFDQARQLDPQAFAEFVSTNPGIADQGSVANLSGVPTPDQPATSDILRGRPDLTMTQTAPQTPQGGAAPVLPTAEELARESTLQTRGVLGNDVRNLEITSPLGTAGRPSPGFLDRFFGAGASDGLLPLSKILGFGGAALGLGTGVIGLIQRMSQGDRAAAQRIKEVFATASPEQKQGIRQALQAFQTAQQQIPELINTLGMRAPFEQGAFEQGVMGLQDVTRGLLAGRLPISPDLDQTVESAFVPGVERTLRAGIENLRNRGFAGAFADTSATLTPFVQQALAEQAGQMAREKLMLRENLARLGIGGLSGLLGLGQQGLQNRMNFLQSSILPGQAAGGVGTQLQATQGRTTTTQKPFSLLDAFGPLSQLLTATGGVLGGAGSASASGSPRPGTLLGA